MHLGAETRYGVHRAAWRTLLGVAPLPEHRDWPEIFAVIRRLVRWVHEEPATEYLDHSRGRDLLEEVTPLLHFAGIPAPAPGQGAEVLDPLLDVLRRVMGRG